MNIFESFAHKVTLWTGSNIAFYAALGVILIWLITGPVFGYSDTWQLVINTGTTIITFLMVFLIQHSQNKELLAIHVKLNELIHAQHEARNILMKTEDLNEVEIKKIREGQLQVVTPKPPQLP